MLNFTANFSTTFAFGRTASGLFVDRHTGNERFFGPPFSASFIPLLVLFVLLKSLSQRFRLVLGVLHYRALRHMTVALPHPLHSVAIPILVARLLILKPDFKWMIGELILQMLRAELAQVHFQVVR